MKKFVFISLLFFSGCSSINVSDGSSLKIVEVSESFTDDKYFNYKVRDKGNNCYYFFSDEKFLVGDSVKIVKVEQNAEISSDPK